MLNFTRETVLGVMSEALPRAENGANAYRQGKPSAFRRFPLNSP
jgi:hypothetical protein